MSWFSKATGIHVGSKIKRVVAKAWPLSFLTMNPALIAASAVAGTQAKKSLKRQEDRDVANAASVAAQQAHDAEVDKLAENYFLGPGAMRRRRGVYATKLTGSSTAGSTLLSQ